jgi:hypothetical protein
MRRDSFAPHVSSERGVPRTTRLRSGLGRPIRKRAARFGLVAMPGRVRRRPRLAYVVALVWIFVGCALYAVEVLKLLSGLG